MDGENCNRLAESLNPKTKINVNSGENTMDDYNGGLNPNTAATLALLADTSRAGRGTGYGGGYGEGYGGGYGSLYTGNSVLAANAHADGTAVKEAIDSTSQKVEDQADFNREIFSKQMDNTARSFEAAQVSNQFDRICDRINGNEARNGDRLRDIERIISGNAKDAAKCCCDVEKSIAAAAKEAALCCCDAKLRSCEDKAEILASASRDKAEILIAIGAIKDRELDAANAKITQLETINALSNNSHHGH